MKRARFLATGSLAIAASSWGLEFGSPPSAAVEAPPFSEVGGFAVVTISGPLTTRPTPVVDPISGAIWHWDNYETIKATFDAALASSASALILKLDSPGGACAGMIELVEHMRSSARAVGKPIIAYVDGAACSAAYAIACAAEKIVIPPTGIVGSIGTIKIAVDVTAADKYQGVAFEIVTSGARKADGHPHQAMSDSTRAAMQTEVDAFADLFFDLVSTARPVLGVSDVAALEAGTFLGAKAIVAGLADEVMTFDRLIAMGAVGATTTAREGAEKSMNEKEKAIAALKALAEGDDKEQSDAAKAALKALGAGDDDPEKKDDEPKSEGEDDEPKDEPKDDEPKSEDEDKKADAKAAAKGSKDPVMALAAQVQSLAGKLAAKEEAEERATLLASRPDFDPAVVALMKRSPMAVVRDAVKTLPRGAKAKSHVGAARAAITVNPTVGEVTVPEPLDEESAAAMSRAMGITNTPDSPFAKTEDGRFVLHASAPVPAKKGV